MIKEGQFVTFEEIQRANWHQEQAGCLSGKSLWEFEVWTSPDEQLTVTFFWGMMSALVERA